MLQIETNKLSDSNFKREAGIALSDMLQGIAAAWELKPSDLSQLFVVDEKTARKWLDRENGAVSIGFSGQKMDATTDSIIDFIQLYDRVAGFIVTVHDQKLWLKTATKMFDDKSPLDFMKSEPKNIAEAKLRFDRLSNP